MIRWLKLSNLKIEISEKLTFLLLSQKRESRNASKILDSCLYRNDGIASGETFFEISEKIFLIPFLWPFPLGKKDNLPLPLFRKELIIAANLSFRDWMVIKG